MRSTFVLFAIFLILELVPAHHHHRNHHRDPDERDHDEFDYSRQSRRHNHGERHSSSDAQMKFFPIGFHFNKPKPPEIYVFNVDRYGPWSNWSSCFTSDCIEVRYRKCLDDSWKTFSPNKVHTTRCISKYYGEKRACLNKTKCNEFIGGEIIQNLTDVCGIRPKFRGTQIKIVGGKESIPNTWPWAVRLSLKLPGNQPITFCGGTLITSRWILTAAHCVLVENKRIPVGKLETLADHMKGTIYAHLGDHDVKKQETTQLDHRVTKAILHPKYHRTMQTDGYDIALIMLAEPVDFSPEIGVSCLPPNESDLKAGMKCYAVGWGESGASRVPTFDSPQTLLDMLFMPGFFGHSLFFNDRRIWKRRRRETPESTKEMHEVELPIVSFDKCRNYYMDLNEDVHICAGKKGKDTCSGDSGGGLYCQLPETGRWHVVGVTSFGIARGCGHTPGVYTSVQAHMEWLTKQLATSAF